MKKLSLYYISMLAVIFFLLAAFNFVHLRNVAANRAEDSYVRDRVLLVHSERGSCSGVRVKTPKGKTVVLTAGHCIELVEGGKVLSKDESGADELLSLVIEDPYSD